MRKTCDEDLYKKTDFAWLTAIVVGKAQVAY